MTPSTYIVRTRTAAAALAAAVLAGCSFIPTYERPSAPVPGSYPGASATDAQQGKAAADIRWQDYFTDPQLQTLISLALENNRDQRVAMLRVEQARAQFDIQRAAEYPTANAMGGFTRQPNPANQNKYGSVYQAGLAITGWEIDFFGRIAALKEQALAQYLATDEARKAGQISLVAAVASGWLALVADDELLDLSERTLQTREESVKLTRLRLEHGVSSELDLRQAQSLAEQARATLAQQQRQRMLDENALTLLVGQAIPDELLARPGQRRLAKTAPMQALPAGLPSQLLQHRPDIIAAEQQLIGANASIGAARAAFFPRIALTAQFGSTSTELSGLFKGGSWAFSLAPQAVLPIFDAGRNQANLEAAQVGREIAVAQYEKSIQTAFREVADALAGRATLQNQLDAQAAQTRSDTRRFELSDLRYRNGVASYLDLLDAQRSLYASEQALVLTRLQQLQNQVVLYKVLGGGWSAEDEIRSLAERG
ncbi:efflux transporter outer membrane subunit [Comamonas sp. NLF-1-9]|uniref:efflux transporter outer membrane subunit n=1 Tax=Comamonas sp. NLF-1-9 TaxID=2853163 RepID=UPI001C467F4D|nr:efflux transporter outer membrane subunit [Comamonas sp. NLF-1-9]QXL84338.1 efflux transporter outer membrane subunit [Comamonas sp. NLF-1-9]